MQNKNKKTGSSSYGILTIDWTVDQYIMNVVRANVAADSIRGTFFRVTQH